jgi:hypothetical protein
LARGLTRLFGFEEPSRSGNLSVLAQIDLPVLTIIASREMPMTKSQKQRPEALATFAEASRKGGKKPDDLGVEADDNTEPIPTDPKKKQRAATKVLHKGATGEDTGVEEAIEDLPDRIIESRD